MTAYYNEFDPDAVAALRELIACGIIAPGHVDSRSIKDVTADDLKGYTQVHLFAGAGLWSLAARWAGWPDARPLWSASCPCQGESLAGKRQGADDPRHLWPDVHRLIRTTGERGYGPPVLVGEQVAAAAGTHWLDRVCSDLADEGYTARACDIPACAVDAPHQRQRLWWVALAQPDSGRETGRSLPRPGEGAGEPRQRPHDQSGGPDGGGEQVRDVAHTESLGSGRDEPQRGPQGRAADGRADAGSRGPMADTDQPLVQGQPPARQLGGHEQDRGPDQGHADGPHRDSDVGDAERTRRQGLGGNVDRGGKPGRRPDRNPGHGEEQAAPRSTAEADDSHHGRNGSWWADAEFITCHDGKARRAKPSIPMLVNGMAGRISLWRLAGNSINPVLAAEVIAALLDAEQEIT